MDTKKITMYGVSFVVAIVLILFGKMLPYQLLMLGACIAILIGLIQQMNQGRKEKVIAARLQVPKGKPAAFIATVMTVVLTLLLLGLIALIFREYQLINSTAGL